MQPLDWALLPFSRYFDFSGRSSRAEYWYFTVLLWFVSLLIVLGEQVLGQAVESVLAVVNTLFGLVTFIPSLAVTVRRFHDLNRGGFGLFRYLVPVVVLAILMVPAMLLGVFGVLLFGIPMIIIWLKLLMLMATEGDRGPNLYGPNPYGLTYGY